jgi:hypothetical protein
MGKITSQTLWATWRLGFSINPRVTSKLDELKGNKIWLGGIIDWDLLYFLPKEFGIRWVEWEILKLWCFNKIVRERELKYII